MTTLNSKFYNLAAAVILAVATIFIVVPGVQDVLAKRAHITQLNAEIEATNKKLAEVRDSYRIEKAAYSDRAKKEAAYVQKILPTENDETQIMREMEAYANSLVAPQKLTNLSFSKAESKDSDYSTIPFKAHLNVSLEGLQTLLAKLNKTGQVTATGASRLLSVQKVDINITDLKDLRLAAGEVKGEVEVDLLINAYALPQDTPAKKGKDKKADSKKKS